MGLRRAIQARLALAAVTAGRKRGAAREDFLRQIPQSGPVLEIGPFVNPCLTGPDVAYFDVLDGPALRARAERIGYKVVQVPEIAFVSPTGDLSVVDRSFETVFSSHCIEHQPDLIAHLRQVERILTPGGRYFLIVPDKRYCFDHSLGASNLAEVLAAHRAGQQVHRFESVLEHLALTTHNDAKRHWAGDHYDPGWAESIARRLVQATTAYEAAEGGYIDVHAWQFTPKSFASVLGTLRAMAVTGLTVETVHETIFGRFEFTAVLRKA